MLFPRVARRVRRGALGLSVAAGVLLGSRPAHASVAYGEFVLFGLAQTGSSASTNLAPYFETTIGDDPAAANVHLSLYLRDVTPDHRLRTLEAFVRVPVAGQRVIAGRMRTPFGIHSWSDLYYHPIIGFPASRSGFSPTAPTLQQIDQGVSVTGGGDRLSYEVAWLSGTQEDLRLQNVSIRVQTYQEPWVLGLNGYWGHVTGPTTGADPATTGIASAYGVDWRYSRPHWLLRGEALVLDRGLNRTAWGFHFDVVHHAANNYRLSYAMRLESFDRNDQVGGNSVTNLTGGVRYLISRSTILDVNYTQDLLHDGGLLRGRVTWRTTF